MISPAYASVSISSRRSTRDVVGAERGAAGRHGGGHAGQVAGHHVGVALDDHRPALLGDLPLGLVDAVEHVRLLVERRLGGVQVLRAVVVVEELARAEADHVAGDVPDRPHQPAAEPVDQAARAGLPGQPGGDQLVVAEALLAQVLGEQVPAVRGEAAAVALARRPGRSRAGPGTPGPGGRPARAELLGVELGGGGVRGDQPLLAAPAAVGPGARPGRPRRSAAGCRPGRRAARRTRRR